MFQEGYYSDRYILSSLCPYSCSLVDFACRLGGILDPEFLNQCEITDKNLQKSIQQLKQIPLKYDLEFSNHNYQEEIFLDMDIPYKKQFFDSWEFKQYNSWLIDQNQWNQIYTFNDDLII
jgi:hypothetical protein